MMLMEFWYLIAQGDQAIRENGRDEDEAGGYATFANEKAQEFSPTLKELPSLDAEDVKRWVSYWRYAGLFGLES